MATEAGQLWDDDGYFGANGLGVLNPEPPIESGLPFLLVGLDSIFGCEGVGLAAPAPPVLNAYGVEHGPEQIFGGVAEIVSPSEWPPLVIVAGQGLDRFFQAGDYLGGNTQEVGIDSARLFDAAVGSMVFPASSGRVSHFRVLAAYRNDREAEEAHLAMQETE